MSTYLEDIYKLTNKTILTPSNLLSNIKLDNYNEVKYYKEDNMIICEMSSLEDDEEIKYFYKFDMSDKLQQATILYGLEEIEIFNRNKELTAAIEEYKNIKSKKIS
ncbi:TPA: hypothetical protein PNM84_001355 [Listeria monocytogenes]|nr:hypothetical protein [Listeria monocytogenes]HAA9071034.1 hypothetical protein [Listeria monocytogenes]HDI4828587.1 hypothetical protein [Listeria monocytogenes]HDM9928168.1 hypothetical protein [Listeria monocytogenes]